MAVDQRSQDIAVRRPAAERDFAVIVVAALQPRNEVKRFPHEPRSSLLAARRRVFLVAQLRNITPRAVFICLLYSEGILLLVRIVTDCRHELRGRGRRFGNFFRRRCGDHFFALRCKCGVVVERSAFAIVEERAVVETELRCVADDHAPSRRFAAPASPNLCLEH